jgi:hypothetical protein
MTILTSRVVASRDLTVVVDTSSVPPARRPAGAEIRALFATRSYAKYD